MRKLTKIMSDSRVLDKQSEPINTFVIGSDTRKIWIRLDGKDGEIILSVKPERGEDYSIWDHTSIVMYDETNTFTGTRIPTYQEMVAMKDICFRKDEIAMQIHPKKKDYFSMHPDCLHLWRSASISSSSEAKLKEIIEKSYKLAKEQKSNADSKTFWIEDAPINAVAVFGENDFPGWYDIKKIKRKFFTDHKEAVHFNLGSKFDLNSDKLIVLFSAEDMILPIYV